MSDPPISGIQTGIGLVVAVVAVVICAGLLFAPHDRPGLPLPRSAVAAKAPETASATTVGSATAASALSTATGAATWPEAAVAADAKPPADADAEPGVVMITAPAGADSAADRRPARQIALHVPSGSAVTPFVTPGPFTAVFEGWISRDLWEEFTFTVEGAGTLRLTINGKQVLAADGPVLTATSPKVRLEKGRNRVRAVYRSPPTGAARLRLLWESTAIPLEPVPTAVLSRRRSDTALAAALRQRRGRELIGTLRCTACHALDGDRSAGMPELLADAPDLRQAGERLKPAWLAAWIRDPQALRPGTTMPHLLPAGEAGDRTAADLAAWLAASGTPATWTEPDGETIVAGARLYEKLSCLSCREAAGDRASIHALDRVAAKWHPAALVEFLRQPSRHFAWIGMPDFALTVDEAKALAAYVLSTGQRPLDGVSTGDASRGQAAAQRFGCVSCHQFDGLKQPLTRAKPLAAVRSATTGCLSDVPAEPAPRFALTPDDRTALREFLSTGIASLARRDSMEFAERRLQALNCAACHERDGREPARSLQAERRAAILAALPPEADPPSAPPIDEKAPSLTFAGDKLRPEWTAALLAGHLRYRPRQWLHLRMPRFPAAAKEFAQGLAASAGLPPETAAESPVDPTLTGTGLRIMEGFICSGCHAVGDAQPTGLFEAPGINLAWSAHRLQGDHFKRWILMPQRFDPESRMPAFFPDGMSPQADILGGDGKAQIQAIWQHLRSIGDIADHPWNPEGH